MAKKKQAKTAKNFTEAIGIGNIFKNDIFNFIFGFILLLMAVYVIIAFISFFSTGQADQSLLLDRRPGEWINTGQEYQNSCGSIGAIISYFFISRCFGISSFVIPVLMGLAGLRLMHAYNNINFLKWFLCLVILMLWCSVTFAKFLTPIMGDQVFNPGGDHGQFCCQFLENIIGAPGLTAVLGLVAILFLTYLTTETITVIRKMLNPVGYIRRKVQFVITNDQKKEDPSGKEETGSEIYEPVMTYNDQEPEEEPEPLISEKEPDIIMEVDAKDQKVKNPQQVQSTDGIDINVKAADVEEKANSKDVTTAIDLSTPINPREPWLKYKFPTLDLLKKYDDSDKPTIDKEEQQSNMNRIVEVLNSFGVQIRSIHATVGPTITLYEITPAEGVRISKIRNLEDDIALSLRALGIRIIAPIPGKGTIGIEVPNAKPQMVSMESVINSRKFQETDYELPMALGKTITNEVFMVDLAKMPHLLVAGATGQGKSVGLNAIITSLLYKKHPAELKFVMVDPKKVEFSVYNPIVNHFLAQVEGNEGTEEPIITDVNKVIQTLKSLCVEMDTRYDLLKKARARNVKEYNQKFKDRQLNPENGHKFMPYIVVIIDEFGDLIMTAGKEIELPIARIAQLARAVGIHMIIATQRPTTNIITGTIKANFPARLAFKVASSIDSKTILDRTGANQLIGKGDMLFLSGNDPVRVQCAFVDTPEVEDITSYIACQQSYNAPFPLPEVPMEGCEDGDGPDVDLNHLDPMFNEVARMVVLEQSGSTSMIQRKFSIGYNRAGRLMDQLEKVGIVGPAKGSKPREVLCVSEEDLQFRLDNIG